jgi:cytochrome P450
MPSPPITSDPPEHRPARMPLLPAFNPKAIEKLTPDTRALCNRLIDSFIEKGSCDAATDYAQHIPTRVIANMLGVDEEDGERYRRWIKMALQEGIHDNAKVMEALKEMTGYFAEELARRGSKPGDDLISFMRDQRVDGQPLPPEKLIGTLRLLLIAGIDTTWSAIGASLWHLATHEEDRRRLVADPALMDTAVEEFLRAYAPVTMAREVVKEVRVNGCTMKPGSMVLLSFPAANRDPEVFPDASEVKIDRKENRHAAFGLGIHRCIGSNLARMELRVALEEWLKRIPEFRLEESARVTWSEGTVRGPRLLPVVFGS